MTIKEHVLTYLGTLAPGEAVTARMIWMNAWPGALGPLDWRSVNRALHQLERAGLVKSKGKHLRVSTLWRLK